ncbi:MAG: HD domain-containing protein [Candidatus Binatia bacterium]
MDPTPLLPACACLEPDGTASELEQRLRRYFPDDALVSAAIAVASRAHADHLRAEGTPYVVHPLRVSLTLARRGESAEIVGAALCHDVFEDAIALSHEVYRLGPAVSRLVDVLTDDWHSDYLGRVAAAGRAAALIKLADRIDNIRFLHRTDSFKHRRYVVETRRDFPVVAHAAAAPDLAAALWALVAWQEANPAV